MTNLTKSEAARLTALLKKRAARSAAAPKRKTLKKPAARAKLPSNAEVARAYGVNPAPKKAAPKTLCARIFVRERLKNGEWKTVAGFQAYNEKDAIKEASDLAKYLAEKTNASYCVAK